MTEITSTSTTHTTRPHANNTPAQQLTTLTMSMQCVNCKEHLLDSTLSEEVYVHYSRMYSRTKPAS